MRHRNNEQRKHIMNFKALTTGLFMIFAFHQSASAYSPIFTIDGWNAAQLKEAGITVTAWKHDQIGEDPHLNWVKITYDTSKIGDQNVLMTLQVETDNGELVACSRVERKKDERSEISLIFATDGKNMAYSSVQIIAPQLLSKGLERAFGDPGFGGYSLSLRRIMQIAGKAADNNPPDGSSTAEPASEEPIFINLSPPKAGNFRQ